MLLLKSDSNQIKSLKHLIKPHLYKDFKYITKILSKYTSRAYLVGGACRDLYLFQEIKDLDIEVYDLSLEQFEHIMKTIDAQGVGRDFFVYKYKEIDISLPRVESKSSYGHRGFEVSITCL